MDHIDKVIGENLRAWRESSNLLQSVVAQKLGIHQTALSRVEHGKQRITPAQLMAAAILFETDVLSFMEDRTNE